jgi:hypothetical protein
MVPQLLLGKRDRPSGDGFVEGNREGNPDDRRGKT